MSCPEILQRLVSLESQAQQTEQAIARLTEILRRIRKRPAHGQPLIVHDPCLRKRGPEQWMNAP